MTNAKCNEWDWMDRWKNTTVNKHKLLVITVTQKPIIMPLMTHLIFAAVQQYKPEAEPGWYSIGNDQFKTSSSSGTR